MRLRALTRLVCGEFTSYADLLDVIDVLATYMNSAQVSLRRLGKLTTLDRRIDAAFASRTLLEAGCTVMLSRIDPVRILAVAEAQRATGYDLGKRAEISIQWTGDVSPSSKAPAMQADLTAIKIQRALLGDHYGALLWKPALNRLVDHLVDDPGDSPWLNELKAMDPERIMDTMRGHAGDCFSTLSKGVHHEFVVTPESTYDQGTIEQYVTKTAKFLAQLALVSHALLPRVGALPLSRAVTLFKKIEVEYR